MKTAVHSRLGSSLDGNGVRWNARVVLGMAFAFMLMVYTSFADGRDSLLHWWKVRDLNGDGLLQPGEFYDVMTVGADKPKTATAVYQATDGVSADQLVSIETIEIMKPTARVAVQEPVIRFHNPTNWVNGNLLCNYQAVSANKACIGRMPVDGVKEGTVFIRFKWDGRRFKKNANYAYGVTLYGDDWNPYAGRGWNVGFRVYDSGTPNSMYPSFTYGSVEMGFFQSPHNLNFLVSTNVWYDMAVTFRHTVVDGENRMTRAVLLRKNGSYKHFYDKREGTFTLGSSWTSVGDVDEQRISLGYHSSDVGATHGLPGGTTFVSANTSGDDSFVGAIHEVKEYTKYMNEFELLQTMTDSDPDFMIGSRNGSSDEFSDAGAVEYSPDTMDWSQMKKTFTQTAPHVTVKFELDEDGHALGRLIEMRFLKETPFAGERIDIALNGMRFGSKAIPVDGTLRFFLKSSRLSKLEKDSTSGRYPLSLTVKRGDAIDSTITLDYLSMGGAWQLGNVDGLSGEFGSADYYNNCYCLGQRDIKKLCMSVGNSGSYASTRLFFALSDWAAANAMHRLTFRGANSFGTPISLTVNGDVANRLEFQAGKPIHGADGTNICFRAGTLNGGNEVMFSCDGVSSDSVKWSSLDFLRLETILPDDFRNMDFGMVVTVR